MKEQNEYDDIIHTQYRGVKNRQPMPMESRAAQFAPFAALDRDNTGDRQSPKAKK